MKELEGKTVYLRPIGNLRLSDGGKTVVAKMEKVAIVFVTVRLGGWDKKYRMRVANGTRYLDDDYNGGYVVYETRQEIKDYDEIQRLAGEISKAYRYQSDYAKLDLSTITKVAELLGVKNNESP